MKNCFKDWNQSSEHLINETAQTGQSQKWRENLAQFLSLILDTNVNKHLDLLYMYSKIIVNGHSK